MSFPEKTSLLFKPEGSAASVGEGIDSLPLALTVLEAGAVLRVGRSAIYDLVRCGRLRSLRIGRQIRIPRDAIYAFLNESA